MDEGRLYAWLAVVIVVVFAVIAWLTPGCAPGLQRYEVQYPPDSTAPLLSFAAEWDPDALSGSAVASAVGQADVEMECQIAPPGAAGLPPWGDYAHGGQHWPVQWAYWLPGEGEDLVSVRASVFGMLHCSGAADSDVAEAFAAALQP